MIIHSLMYLFILNLLLIFNLIYFIIYLFIHSPIYLDSFLFYASNIYFFIYCILSLVINQYLFFIIVAIFVLLRTVPLITVSSLQVPSEV